MAELKPCPFCGGEAKLRKYKDACVVVCTRCFAQSGMLKMGVDYSARAVVIAAWNMRADNEK